MDNTHCAGDLAVPIDGIFCSPRESSPSPLFGVIGQTVVMSKDRMRPSLAELGKLFPGLSPEELETAEENLRRFVEVAIRICEQKKTGPDTDSDPSL